jgi:hypothetical protein
MVIRGYCYFTNAVLLYELEVWGGSYVVACDSVPGAGRGSHRP